MGINKPLVSITEEDIQAIVSAGAPEEGKTIEYKGELPKNDYESKKEFLADVSSFANAAGGELFFGIEEASGIPVNICGLHISNPDKAKLRLENMLRDSIEPRIPGISIKAIQASADYIMIIRVPRSWAGPHAVKLRKHWRFYSRNSAGKYPLDVPELRGQFLSSATRTERIRNFRAERLGKIVADEAPGPLTKAAKTVVHIVPFGAFDPAFKVDMTSLEEDDSNLKPIGVGTASWRRYNLDGFLTYTKYVGDTRSYLQIFRNGCVEAVTESIMQEIEEGQKIIQSGSFEYELLCGVSRFLSVQERLGVEPPLFVMVSLLGVHGYLVKPSPQIAGRFWKDDANPIDRSDLLLPEIMIDSFEVNLIEVVRPIFDSLWNASGWPQSKNYDNEGKWLEKDELDCSALS
jgi:hypothetical protein